MTVNVTLTFPEAVLERIDRERGDVKRSTYITKFLQHTWEAKLSESIVSSGNRIQNENRDSLKKLPQGPNKVRAHRDPLTIVESKPPIVTKSDSEHE